MRYLLAVQFKVWQGSIIRSRAVRSTHGPIVGDGAARPTRVAALRVPSDVVADVPLLTVELPEAMPGVAASRDRLDRISRSIKPFLAMHVTDLERFVALCRDNGVRLTVAINPMREENALGFEPGHLDAMVDRINSLTDVWDFKSPDWLARDSAYWLDVSHFSKAVAELMLRRMYADGAGVPADFGRFRPRTAQAAAVQGQR
jgi:hypothetical protein